VGIRNFTLGLAGNFIVSAVLAYLTNSTEVAAIAFCIGLVLLLVAAFIGRKTAPFQAPPSGVNRDVKQEASPHVNAPINISIGNSSSTATAAAPTPAPERTQQAKPEPRCNIKFKDVKIGHRTPDGPFPQFRPPFPYSAAVFENELVEGCEPLTPTVKARAIFRHPDGHEVLDLSDVAWIPGLGKTYETFDVNTPRYLNLFTLKDDHLFCRAVEFIGVPIGRRNRGSIWRDHPIIERVGSVEIQLLTKTGRPYGVVLQFADTGNGLPRFTGNFTEL